MFGREDEGILRSLIAQKVLTEADSGLRALERAHNQNPEDKTTRQRYVAALDRFGDHEAADRVHFSQLAVHGPHLADAHKAWLHHDDPSTRETWHRNYNRALDHAMDLVRDRSYRNSDRRSEEDHTEALHQITTHIPRNAYPEGESGDRQHRGAIMAVHRFTTPELRERSRRTTRSPYQERSSAQTSSGPETYIGLGERLYGDSAVRSLAASGYDKTHNAKIGPHPTQHFNAMSIHLTRKDSSA